MPKKKKVKKAKKQKKAKPLKKTKVFSYRGPKNIRKTKVFRYRVQKNLRKSNLFRGKNLKNPKKKKEEILESWPSFAYNSQSVVSSVWFPVPSFKFPVLPASSCQLPVSKFLVSSWQCSQA